jgi:hypothetical protein
MHGVGPWTDSMSMPDVQMKGHTSYLTFATLLPRVVRQEADPTLEREKEVERRKLIGQEKARLRRQEKEAEEKAGEGAKVGEELEERVEKGPEVVSADDQLLHEPPQ